MATYNKHLAHKKYPNIPTLTLSNLELYVEKGIYPGGFLNSVLCNDLFEAFNYADKENAEALHNLVKVIFNDVPMIAHGSKERVGDWHSHNGLAGDAA